MNSGDTQRRWRWAEAAGWAVLAACCMVALLRALTAASVAPARRLSDAERIQVGRAAAEREPTWRLDARRSFPDDHWSQDDDFANTERRWVRDEASRLGVPQLDVFRAIDEDLRRYLSEPPRKATAAPSRPRPAYD